jgi:hypothetical protein
MTTITKARTHTHTHTHTRATDRNLKDSKKEKFRINKRMAVETITNIKHKTITILVNLKSTVKVG